MLCQQSCRCLGEITHDHDDDGDCVVWISDLRYLETRRLSSTRSMLMLFPERD